jgi:hypothetical protein
LQPFTLALVPGTRLGPYEIAAQLGKGGMGEVYRAFDTNLGRQVAIKILPDTFVHDPEQLARFDREAKTLAALNHPNIAQIYWLDRSAGVTAIVMELVEGPTLADRIAHGAIPVEEALSIAKQVAEALEAAHEQGIIHRDLKPANIKVTADGVVKVLDFGLAKAAGGVPTGAGDSQQLPNSPTVTSPARMTQPGIILGTAAYMSPEQARGKPVDRRGDIWAFGVVLYEMLSGKPLFTGETVSDVLAAVLTHEPRWSELPCGTPPALRRLLERCLERNPQLRLRDIGEARIALSAQAGGSEREANGVAARSWPRGVALLAAGLAVGVASTALWSRSRRPERTPGPPVVAARFVIDSRDTPREMVSVSPDGQRLAFIQSGRGITDSFWTQRLDELGARELPGTEQAVGSSFWSPDGRRLALYTRTEFKVVDVEPGVFELTRSRAQLELLRGGTWGSTGVILLGANDAIYRLPEGGAPTPIVEPRYGETAWHGWPSFLPDGRRFLFTSQVREGDQNVTVIQVADLESPQTSRVVLRRALGAFWSDGHLVYGADGGGLYAQRSDPRSLAPEGAPFLIGPNVDLDTRRGFVAASGSANGVVAFRGGTTRERDFVWLDRTGRRLGKASDAGPWHNFDLSRDGSQIATTTLGRDSRGARGNRLVLIEPGRKVATELSSANAPSISDPIFSPDGTGIAMRLGDAIVVQPARGGEAKVLFDKRGFPDSWSTDGRWLLFGMASALGKYELFALDTHAPGNAPVLLVNDLRFADEPRFAPNGNWIAYHASTASSGKTEVFMIPFPPTGERWQVSNGGGVQPRFSHSGDALFYLGVDGRLMKVAMPAADARKASAPQPLFETGLIVSNSYDQYAVAPDGRFLFQLPAEGSQPGAPIHVVIGWAARDR